MTDILEITCPTCGAEGTPPCDLIERLEKVRNILLELGKQAAMNDRFAVCDRINAKREGVELALSYARAHVHKCDANPDERNPK